MLKKLQALKAKKGFTLVELIVVIAIIGVLAAILVPTLMGQVTKARVTSLDQTAATFKDMIGNWMVDCDANAIPVPGTAKIEINVPKGTTFATTHITSDVTLDSTASTKLFNLISDNYNFNNKNINAIIYIEDKKVIGCAYSDIASKTEVESITDAMFKSGTTSLWDPKTDGKLSSGSNLIGTNPKLLSTT